MYLTADLTPNSVIYFVTLNLLEILIDVSYAILLD